ncbi:MAG TPA: YqjK family protein [Methylophilaceae bacterium]|jgi:hypothetical protein
MNLTEIRIRRTLLLLRIAQQRSAVEIGAQSLKSPAHLYDQGYALARKIKQHPVATSVGGALFSMLVLRKLPFRKLGVTALISLMSWWQASHQPKSSADS